MKIASRITTIALIALLLYGGGYWVLIKKGVAYQHLAKHFSANPTNPLLPLTYPTASKTHEALVSIFKPASELEDYLILHPKIRKHLTGHWTSDSNADFVTINPAQKCQFQLGEFVFDGKLEYDYERGCFRSEVAHEGQTLTFEFRQSHVCVGAGGALSAKSFFAEACIGSGINEVLWMSGDNHHFSFEEKTAP